MVEHWTLEEFNPLQGVPKKETWYGKCIVEDVEQRTSGYLRQGPTFPSHANLECLSAGRSLPVYANSGTWLGRREVIIMSLSWQSPTTG
jgi:hypothetical protein